MPPAPVSPASSRTGRTGRTGRLDRTDRPDRNGRSDGGESHSRSEAARLFDRPDFGQPPVSGAPTPGRAGGFQPDQGRSDSFQPDQSRSGGLQPDQGGAGNFTPDFTSDQGRPPFAPDQARPAAFAPEPGRSGGRGPESDWSGGSQPDRGNFQQDYAGSRQELGGFRPDPGHFRQDVSGFQPDSGGLGSDRGGLQQDPARQDPARQDSGRQDSGRQGPARQDSGLQDSGHQNSGREDSGRQGAERQDSGRQDLGRSALFDTDPGLSAYSGASRPAGTTDPGLFDTDPGRSSAFAPGGRSGGFGDEREQAAPFVPAPGPVRPEVPGQGQTGGFGSDSGWGSGASDQGHVDRGASDQGTSYQGWGDRERSGQQRFSDEPAAASAAGTAAPPMPAAPTTPAAPAHTTPAAPEHLTPPAPAHTTPAAPVHSAPAGHTTPAAPAYTTPTEPAHSTSTAPEHTPPPPHSTPAAPAYTAPAAHAPPAAPAAPTTPTAPTGPAAPGALGAFRPEPASEQRSTGYEPGLRAAQPRPSEFEAWSQFEARQSEAYSESGARQSEASQAEAQPGFDARFAPEARSAYEARPAEADDSATDFERPPPAFQPARRDSAPADPSGFEGGEPTAADAPEIDAWPETRTGPALEAEPAMGLGLGARLAALQAQSGGFAMITPDEVDDETPPPSGRGMWDPKVPPVPAEPDEEESPTPHADRGSPSESATPSPQDFEEPEPEPEPEPDPEPEPVNWNYADYPPANTTEEELLEATRSNTSNQMLSTLLLAKVLIPGYSADPAHWPAEEIRGRRYLVAFTSMQRLTAHYEATLPEPEPVRFTTVIAKWPTEAIGFALNPGTPMGRLLGGSEVRGLARSAAEFGLIDADALVAVADAEEASAQTQAIPAKKPEPAPESELPQLMQRTVAAAQVSMYLERGYDRVCGFVHRAAELAHLSKPAELYRALGLIYPDSPFGVDDTEVYVLRWPAHLLSLYRIPYGGQTEEALNAMQGWMIERAPFRGNGFAPSETGDVVSEFKMDSTRLPHGAQLWRLNSDGIETLVALFDADSVRWRRIGSGES